MWQVLKAIIWGALWVCGIKLFDEALMLEGGWLMCGGACTFIACQTITGDLFD